MAKEKKGHPILLALVIVIVVFAGIGGCVYYGMYSASKKITDEISNTMAEHSYDNTAEVSTVIYNKDGVKITYNGIVGGAMQAEIKLLIENSSSDKINIMVSNITIDGYTINTYMYTSLPAGKKTNESLSILNSYLDDNGLNIKTIKNAEIEMKIYSDMLDQHEEMIKFSLK